ncbi:Kinetochore protein NDC80 [Galdieria sulphuraria]|uniref:Kinetochore protein NDC80 n=1 Tax=Galdieria sulphuraria TaxID=130081 RepID=M2X9B9_GALSU|nr:kinetochore protein NDC8 [Galdieria sulphuraria]EME26412.1 kinetochore protein NDC8 [Galdieria sulphuraria]GJD11890.1 Kinetochore protein NDC80 [Galdieria sulphuraria]|eukprot:XP_005702932.1 kinetochore protein NDC8 [Galdieria sulphuraria]
MRRTTLSSVSTGGNIQQRLSLGPSRANLSNSKEDLKTSSAQRPRLSASSTSTRYSSLGVRRSSVFTNKVGLKVDPRPLNDKSYLNDCVRNLIYFLSTHGYDQAISPKTLTTPTSKEFQSILLFLLRKIDPYFDFEKKFEEELPTLFKTLKYPFTISKSTLYAVGSPHTWPTLLGLLVWITDLLAYDEQASSQETKSIDTESSLNRIFFDYVSRSYQAFLGGADSFDEFDEELAATFDKENNRVESETEELEREIKRFQDEYHQLIEKRNSLESLRQKIEDYKKDIEKFKTLINQLEQHRQVYDKKIADRDEELQNEEKNLEVWKQEKNRLRQIIEDQELNHIDGHRLQRDKQMLTEALEKAYAHRQEAIELQSKVDEKLIEQTAKVEDALRDYHRLAEKLQLIPSTAKNAKGFNFEIELSRDASLHRCEDILSLDLSSVVKPTIHELREAFSSKASRTREEELTVQEKYNHLEEQLLFKRNETSSLEGKYQKLENHYKNERETLASYLESKARETSELEQEVAQMKASNDSALRESQQALDSAYSEYKQTQKQLYEEKEQMNDALLQSIELLTMYKMEIRDKVNSYSNKLEEVYQFVCSS